MSNQNASAVAEPAECSLDLPSMLVPSEGASVLPRLLLPTSTVRRDLFDAAHVERIPQPVCISRFVIQQAVRAFVEDRHVHQRLDGVDFSDLGRGRECGDGNSLSVRHQHQLGALALLGLANFEDPFFAGEKVPSPIACDQSSRPRPSRSWRSRRHASTMSPASVQSRCRRQHVAGLGKRSGRCFHWEPDRRIQRMPSRHSRGSIRGLPPFGEGSGFSNRSRIRAHWASVRNEVGTVLDPVVFGRRRGGHIDREMIIEGNSFHLQR